MTGNAIELLLAVLSTFGTCDTHLQLMLCIGSCTKFHSGLGCATHMHKICVTQVLHQFVLSLTIIDTYRDLQKDNINMHGMRDNKYKETNVSLTQPLCYCYFLCPTSVLKEETKRYGIYCVYQLVHGLSVVSIAVDFLDVIRIVIYFFKITLYTLISSFECYTCFLFKFQRLQTITILLWNLHVLGIYIKQHW